LEPPSGIVTTSQVVSPPHSQISDYDLLYEHLHVLCSLPTSSLSSSMHSFTPSLSLPIDWFAGFDIFSGLVVDYGVSDVGAVAAISAVTSPPSSLGLAAPLVSFGADFAASAILMAICLSHAAASALHASPLGIVSGLQVVLTSLLQFEYLSHSQYPACLLKILKYPLSLLFFVITFFCCDPLVCAENSPLLRTFGGVLTSQFENLLIPVAVSYHPPLSISLQQFWWSVKLKHCLCAQLSENCCKSNCE